MNSVAAHLVRVLSRLRSPALRPAGAILVAVTGTAATTILEPARCTRNALSRLAPPHTRERRSSHHVPARQRCFAPHAGYDTRQKTSVAGDDPVNGADPSGLDSKYGLTLGACGSFVAAANVKEMGGPFYAVQANLDVIAGASAAVLRGASNPPGNTSIAGPFSGIFGVEFSYPPPDWAIGGDVGIWLQNTWVHEFSGWACWLSGQCLIAKGVSEVVSHLLPSKSKADVILNAAWPVVEKHTEPTESECTNPVVLV
jgi:hypothetical protein